MKKTIAAILLLAALLLFCSCDSEPREVRTAEINEKGELVIIFTDGTRSTVGMVKGEKGDAGENGLNGADGKDGVDGKDGKDGQDGKKGDQGLKGAMGISVNEIKMSDDGNLTVIYSNNTQSKIELLGELYLFGGKCGESAAWAIYNGGILVIGGEGATYDYEAGTTPWNSIIPMISAVYVDTSSGLTKGKNLLYGIDESIISYPSTETTVSRWVDMTVRAPIYATPEEIGDEDATPLAYLPLGTEIQVVSEETDVYCKLLYEGGYAYIDYKYGSRNNPDSVVYNAPVGFSKIEVTGSDGATLRYFPDTKANNAYNTYAAGTEFTCIGVSLNEWWYKVSFEDEILYVYKSVVTPIYE